MIFGFGKKKLAERMLSLVDCVKVVLCDIFFEEFNKKFDEKGKDYNMSLSVAAVHEIFGCHNNTSEPVFNDNKEIIINTIQELGKLKPELKRPITDALRIYWASCATLNRDVPISWVEKMQKAMDSGIFIKDGEPPHPDAFQDMVIALAEKYPGTEKT